MTRDDIVNFIMTGSFNGIKKGSHLIFLKNHWGKPDAISNNKKPPYIYRYGNADVTIYDEVVVGLGVDLNNCHLISRAEVEKIIENTKLRHEYVRDDTIYIEEDIFITFEKSDAIRIGLRM